MVYLDSEPIPRPKDSTLYVAQISGIQELCKHSLFSKCVCKSEDGWREEISAVGEEYEPLLAQSSVFLHWKRSSGLELKQSSLMF